MWEIFQVLLFGIAGLSKVISVTIWDIPGNLRNSWNKFWAKGLTKIRFLALVTALALLLAIPTAIWS